MKAFPVQSLTRISQRLSTALRSLGLLDVLPYRPAEPVGRAGWNAPDASCTHTRLRRLATKPFENCGFNVSCCTLKGGFKRHAP